MSVVVAKLDIKKGYQVVHQVSKMYNKNLLEVNFCLEKGF